MGEETSRLPDWSGECVLIVASGPSVAGVDFSIFQNRIHVIAVNNSWSLVPWGDMLYACDWNWWSLYRGCREFQGLKVTQDKVAKEAYPDLVRIEVNPSKDEIMIDRFGEVGGGGNGGFQAMNLAVQCGATAIALAGFDMIGDHWHGRHLPPCTNPNESAFRRWRASFEGSVPILHELEIDVVNLSQISTLMCYPKISVPEVLTRWGL